MVQPRPSVWRELLRTRTILVYPIIFLELAQAGILFPILPGVIQEYFVHQEAGQEGVSCVRIRPLPQACKDKEGVAVVTKGLVEALSFFLTFLIGPMVGSLADALGRLPFSVLSQLTSFIPSIMLVLYRQLGLSLWVYFLSDVISGTIPTFFIFQAMIADVVDAEQRSQAFALLPAFLALGLLCSSPLGATLPIGVVFAISTVLGGVGLALTFALRETAPLSGRKALREVKLPNPFKSMRILVRSPLFIKISTCALCSSMSLYGINIHIMKFYLASQLDFTEGQVVIWLSSFGVGGIVFCGLMGQLRKRLSDREIFVLGSVASVAEKLVYAVMTQPWQAYAACGVLGGLSSLSFPALAAIKANNVAKHEQGLAQGAISAAKFLAQAVALGVMSGLYYLTTSPSSPLPRFAPAVFLLAALLDTVCVVVAWMLPTEGVDKAAVADAALLQGDELVMPGEDNAL